MKQTELNISSHPQGYSYKVRTASYGEYHTLKIMKMVPAPGGKMEEMSHMHFIMDKDEWRQFKKFVNEN